MSLHASIHSEGGLLPANLLARIRARDPALPGLRPTEDYGLAPGETLNEAASRSWSRLTGLWNKFITVWQTHKEGDAFEGETLDRWLKPLFQELGFAGLERVRAETLGSETFAISHRWKAVPIHLVGAGLLIDKRTPGARGAAAANPHGLLQDYLNRKDEYVWGLVSNGFKLRLLRDNRTLTRQAYVEFNLEAIFSAEGQSGYADFFLLWLICHRTRFDAPGGGDTKVTVPASYTTWIIEAWTKAAQQIGVTLQNALRRHTVRALNHLGTGFLSHRANGALRQRLQQPGGLSRDDFKRQMLRTLYRLLFLFVAEDRGLLLAPDASPAIKERYLAYYSTDRLRRVARRCGGTAHGDGWVQLQTLFRLLRVEAGCPALGLPPLGGFLFSPGACPDLDNAALANEHLYAAIRALCVVQDQAEGITRVTDFEHLGAEELGSLYESLLELGFKEWSVPAGVCELADAPGNERKLTGSYYTPTSLITSLLDTALDPVIERALGAPNAEAALLALKICDPACGSGHFLVAAGHRLARHIAALRTGEREPPVEAVRHALREVAARCLYGVDLNPLSVELCKVSIWLEALEPGCPLAFLESHIQCGNSLLGCTPALLKKGLPDEAFKPLTGDDPIAARKLAADNRTQSGGQELFELAPAEPFGLSPAMPKAFARVDNLPDDSATALLLKQNEWEEIINSGDYQRATFLHDAWCAAFVLPRRANDFTYHFHTAHLRKLERGINELSPALTAAIEWLGGNALSLSEPERERSYRFFHWHLRFPSVFHVALNSSGPENPSCGWSGGFDVLLGNPPWERVKLSEQEWFASRHEGIINAQTAAERKLIISELKSTDPTLHAEYLDALRKSEGESHLLRDSGRYPLCGRGDVNTYSVFAELMTSLGSSCGRAGFIVPTGIATDDGGKYFFQSLVDGRRLAVLQDFENRKKLFPDVDSRMKFSLLTVAGAKDPQPAARFFFFALGIEDLSEPERQIELTPEDIANIKPNTRTCPIFRTRRDADITRSIYSRVPVLIREAQGEEKPEINPWEISFMRMLDMSNASHLFRTRTTAEGDSWELRGNNFLNGQDRLLPLYESKLFHHFDHRWATFIDSEETRDISSGEKSNPATFVMPRYWVNERDCLLIAAQISEELRDAIGMVWRPGTDKDRDEGAARLRRELGRWLAGWRLANGQVEAGTQLLRQILADANKKRSDKLWRTLEETALELALDYELSAEEAAIIAGILDTPLPEQITALWSLLGARAPKWFLAFRDITNSTNERTSIFTAIPWAGVGNNAPLLILPKTKLGLAHCIVANLASFAFDFPTRLSVGGTHMNFFVAKQLPVLPPDTYQQPTPWKPSVKLADWLRAYVLELCFTAYDLRGFAADCGHTGPPFRWDDTRRSQLRAELDAAFFHLYGLNRTDTEYVLNTFIILRNDELKILGKFETAQRILTAYDEMAAAMASGAPFATHLVPPPADPSRTHVNEFNLKDFPMSVKITRATIRNYRSLAGDGQPVTLGQVTVLVGPNDSGKSSFCDALAFLADAVRNGLPAAISNNDNRRGFATLRRKGSEKISFRLDVEQGGILDGFYELELEGAADGYRVAREAAQWLGAFAVKNGEWEKDKRLEGVSIPPGATALLLPLLRGDDRFSKMAEAIAGIVVYSVPPIILRDIQPKSPAIPMDGRGKDWPSALDRVLKGPLGGMLIVALNRLTGDIANVEVETVGAKQVVRFLHREPETAEGGRWATADQESDGTLRAAALLTALAQDPAPALIAIEEPELAIHPGALSILYDFIQSAQRRSQILITTHSPDLLDNFEADLLRVVYRENDVTRIAAIDEDQREAVHKKLTTLGNVIRHEGMRPGEPKGEI